MKEISLTKGAVALVDDEDFDRITQHSWYLWHGCATRTYTRPQRSGRRLAKISMQREVLRLSEGEKFRVSHIDGNKLNNCKANLLCKKFKQPEEPRSFLHF